MSTGLDKITNRIVQEDITLFHAMEKMNEESVKVLFVFRDDTFLGILTIGDIQRAIIGYNNLNLAVGEIIDKNKIYAHKGDSLSKVKEIMSLLRAECMPVVDEYGALVDVYFWNELFVQGQLARPALDVPVLIMAGGKGTRLRPLTNVIPKPLIPIGEKTILEDIMDKFESIGCHRFFISVNYKNEILRFYIKGLQHKYDINYIKEEKPLGTIGSLYMLRGRIDSPFFVSNCDIIIDQDYRDVYEYHINNKNDITIVTALKTIRIPYGVVETESNGIMKSMTEKPNTTYMINTGVYVLNPELISKVPDNSFMNITDLIDEVRNEGGRVGCFPVSEHAWTDMGDIDEYINALKK